MHGKGTFTDAGGSTYEGKFANDFRHSEGKWTGANGSSYEGQWRDDKKHGTGSGVDVHDDGYMEESYADENDEMERELMLEELFDACDDDGSRRA